jgi:hypothetical protein
VQLPAISKIQDIFTQASRHATRQSARGCNSSLTPLVAWAFPSTATSLALSGDSDHMRASGRHLFSYYRLWRRPFRTAHDTDWSSFSFYSSSIFRISFGIASEACVAAAARSPLGASWDGLEAYHSLASSIAAFHYYSSKPLARWTTGPPAKDRISEAVRLHLQPLQRATSAILSAAEPSMLSCMMS